MIKLELPLKPESLTPEFQAEMTQEFIDSGKSKSVWHIDWLREAVLQMAFGKCCYSEIRLNEESKYLEIEHFHHKDGYPNEVMQWGNLLPSCKKCNATKNDHDTVEEPIVNPFIDNPKDFFRFKNYRYAPQNEKARLTIDVLALNDRDHFVTPRFTIGNEIMDQVEDCLINIDNVDNSRKRRRYITRLKSLLEQGNRTKEYAALVATTILSDENYKAIEEQLIDKGHWDAEFTALKLELEYCALL